ncbi:MAG: diguanylate cyclase domain-containing protein [Solirubrobacteraceae bacterium]
MRIRLVTPATSRFAVAGLALVLLSLAALSLWLAVSSRESAERLGRSALQTDARLEAVRGLARLSQLVDGYDNRPTRAALARLEAAEGELWQAVHQLTVRGSLPDTELARDVRFRMQAFSRKRAAWSDAMAAGRLREAAAIEDGELDPLLAGIQEAIDARAPDPLAAFRTELDRFERSESVARRFTLAAVPAGLALLLLCWAIVRSYRRRTEEHARVQIARSERAATTDPLTGLWNRRKLTADLDEALRHGAGAPERVLVLLDLDGFKLYNDTFGHPAGDSLLVRLAARLAAVVGTDGCAYRMGGDEFCAVLRPGRGPVAAIVAALEAALSERGEGFEVTASSGAAVLPSEAGDAVTAMQLADQRMYASKARSGVLSGGAGAAARTTGRSAVPR